MMDTNRRRLIGFAGGAAALAALKVQGQEKFPSKPIEVVTHSGVGGGTDITARMMMVHAPGVFKTEFVVVNRTGGSGAAAMDYLLERKDGHCIALITQATAPSEPVRDPLGRDTPRGTVAGFTIAVYDDDMATAAQYMQLTAAQVAGAFRRTQLAKRFGFDLPNPFASDVELLADLL